MPRSPLWPFPDLVRSWKLCVEVRSELERSKFSLSQLVPEKGVETS